MAGPAKVIASWRRFQSVSKLARYDEFCLYLWRSVTAPGILYLAKGIESAEAVCSELAEEGYIVKVIHAVTDTEYVLRDGTLRPTTPPEPLSQRSAKKRLADSSSLAQQPA